MKTLAASSTEISVYFDGLCHLCSREIRHYQKMNGAERIRFVDITDAAFDAAGEGLDPVAVHRHLHAREKDGSLKTGVDAFFCIWNQLPALRFLVPIARFAPIYYTLVFLYAAFARVRPFLPRRSCDASPYCEWKQKP